MVVVVVSPGSNCYVEASKRNLKAAVPAVGEIEAGKPAG